MKILRITAKGFPLFKEDLDICFYTQQRVSEDDKDSLYNTPPAYGIYICGLVFKWLKKMGGLEKMKELNEKKAKILYDFLDNSKLFKLCITS